MSDMPWFRFFPSDWLGGTRGLTASEAGVYITLVALMYEREGYIDANHARLSRLCGASNSAFKKAIETLLEDGKITLSDGKYTQERVLKELSYRREKQTVAEKAAKTRWDKNSTKSKDEVQRTHSEGNAIPEARIHIPEDIPPISPKGEVDEAVEIYSDMAKRTGLPEPRKVSQARRRKIGSVLNEYSLDLWKEAVDAIEASGFCRGNNDRGWQASLDFLLQRKSFDGLIEGKYADRTPIPSRANQSQRRETAADVLFNLAERMDNAERSEDDRKAIGFVPSIVNGRA